MQLRFAPYLLAALALPLTASPARAEILRITCDNYLEEIYVDGVLLAPLGPNSNNWTAPDDYSLDLAPGTHVIAVRASDDGSTVAGLMAVLFADDGTTPLALITTGALQTVAVDPGAGWAAPSFDSSSWPVAVVCANPGPWGGSLAWGRGVGADMVWGPTQCDGLELGSRRWFRWSTTVPECLATMDCDDRNECTTDSCAARTCAHATLASGTPCTVGVCNGSPTVPRCVVCEDTSASGTDLGCATAAPNCRTVGVGAPRCEVCDDTTSAGLDLGCTAAAPNCALGAGGRSACVMCETDASCSDGDDCTTNSCSSGMCSTVTLSVGAPCSRGICDANLDCSAVAVDITTPADGSASRDTMPRYSGTATPGTTVTVSVDGAVIGTAVAAADGTWSLASPSTLAEGSHTATATITTSNGTATDSTTFVVDLGTSVAITTPADGSTTRDASPDVRGTGEAGATVVVTIDGAIVGMATVAADGTWSIVLAAPLSNGMHTASASSTDPSGNTASATSTFTVDARTTIVIETPANGSRSRERMPTITGTAEPGATVVVTVDGVVVGMATAGADGGWSVSTTAPLADGSHTAEATATDVDGNVAADTSTFTVDDETLVSITSVAGRTVSGTGEPGATIVVTVDGRAYPGVMVAADGTWSVELDEPLPPGTHEVVADATDSVGNTARDTETVVVTTPDAGIVDAGTADGGPRDAGADATSGDGGAFDGGTSDASNGTPDTGGAMLGGLSGGALCSAQPGRSAPVASLPFGLVALAFFVRRRRR